MLSRFAFLTLGFVAASALFIAVAWTPPSTQTTQKTDRLIGSAADQTFFVERFAG